jgi:hypothetical protein
MTKSFITAFTAAPGPVSAFLSFLRQAARVSPLRSEEPRATGSSLPDRLLWDVGVLDTNPDCIRRKPGGTSGVESEMRRRAY